MKFSTDTLDEILKIQLLIARLGEKESMNWWNLDISFEEGGADFLTRLVGDTHPNLPALSIADGLLLACNQYEENLIAQSGQSLASLFSPEPELLFSLKERLRYFKKYPDTLPDTLIQVLDSSKEWTTSDVQELLAIDSLPSFEGTTVGCKVPIDSGIGVLDSIKSLTSVILGFPKGQYSLAYFQGA